jgi:metal-responsive CopG/Arc/MetJ family transcriptional regulator
MEYKMKTIKRNTSVRIPWLLAKSIDKKIVNDDRGFRSRTDFIVFATRKFLKENGGCPV